jgi:glycosyltransferase involved in cell wall biosynthesis
MNTTLIRPPKQKNHPRLPDPLSGRDMLCFSHDWGGDPLSKNHLMRLLARDNRILWVNSIGYRAPSACAADVRRAFNKVAAALKPIREPEPNIFVFNPLAIPAYGIAALRTFNKHLLRLQVRQAMTRLGFRRPVNWVFNPGAGLLAGDLGEDLVIYYCVDEYTAFSGVASKPLAELEERLLRRADLVIVSADRLYKSKSRLNPNTVLVRHGVDFHHFRQALSPQTMVPDDIARLPRPILGYFGLLAADWVDVDLLVHVARSFPHGSLVLLGKVTTLDVSKLASLPNVHSLGRKPFAMLPAYSKGFDVGLIPFPISEVTLNSNPLKAREYLAAGLPVISTPIPEVESLSQCRIARDPESFAREIESCLASPGSRIQRSETMRREGWDARLDEIRGHVASLVP